MLNLKKLLTKLCEKVTTKKATITPTHRTGDIMFRRVGDIVLCWSPYDFTTLPKQSSTTIGKIPSGYEPGLNIVTSVQNNPQRMIGVRFYPNGDISAYNYSSTDLTSAENGAFFAVWTTV